MKNRLLAATLLVTGTLLACSSSNNNAPLSGPSASSCITSLAASDQACASCLEDNCGAQISTEVSGCGDFLSCICPGGNYDALLVPGCSNDANESSCKAGSQALETCEGEHCSSACGVAAVDAGTD